MRKLAKGVIAGGGVAVLGVALSSAPMLANASCDAHECDPSSADWGCPSGDGSPDDSLCTQGEMTDDGNTWESTPLSADWLDYPGSRTWRLHTACWTGNRVPTDWKIEVAFPPSDGTSNPFPANDPPDAPVSEATEATGNLGELVHSGAGLLEVENATCSSLLARVFIYYAPVPDGGLTSDMMGPCMKKSRGAASSPDGG